MDIPTSATTITAMSTAMCMGQKGMGILVIFYHFISCISFRIIMTANSLNCIIVYCHLQGPGNKIARCRQLGGSGSQQEAQLAEASV